MAKNKNKKAKNNQPKNNVAEQNVEAVEEIKVDAEVVEEPAKEAKAEKPAKADKKQKDNKKKAKKEQPVNKPNKVKETVAELKKVTWPTFGKVVKNTLLVIFIVILSTLVLFGIDYGLSWIYKLLTGTL